MVLSLISQGCLKQSFYAKPVLYCFYFICLDSVLLKYLACAPYILLYSTLRCFCRYASMLVS